MPEPVATEWISARLPADIMEQVSVMAQDERRSLSFMTRILLEEALAARSKAGKNGKK